MEYELNAHLPVAKAKYISSSAQIASHRLSRNYWIITHKYGNGYFDVQKESALVYNFSSSTGKVDGGANSNDDTTRYSHVLCILPGAKVLDVGDVVKLGFYENNLKRPYIKQIIKSYRGKQSMDLDEVIYLSGLWQETWGFYSKNPIINCSVLPASANFPANREYEFETATSGGRGNFGSPPLGLLCVNNGNDSLRLWLVYLRGEETPDTVVVKELDPSFFFLLVNSTELSLTDDIDTSNDGTAGRSPRRPDGAVIWRTSDITGPFLTIIPRPRFEAPASWGDGGLANIWVVMAGGSLTPRSSQITVGPNRGLWQLAVSQPADVEDFYAARLSFGYSEGDQEEVLYGYKLNKDDLITGAYWADEWNINWVNEFQNWIESTNNLAYVFGSAWGRGTLDIPPPQVTRDSTSYWGVPGVVIYETNNPGIFCYRVTEMLVQQSQAGLSFRHLLEKENFTLGDCLFPEDALNQLADYVYEENPGYAEFESSTSKSAYCSVDYSTYEFQEYSRTYWRGILDNQWTLNINDIGGQPQTLFLAQGRNQSNLISAGTPTVLLGPEREPNLNSRHLAAYWRPTHNENLNLESFIPATAGRFVATESGRMYTAVLVPVPVKTPGNINIDSFINISGYDTFGGCVFKTSVNTARGIIPRVSYAYELTFMGLRPGGEVDTLVPYQRFSGQPLPYGPLAGTGTPFFETNVPLPIPENVYGVIVFEDIDCVCWLCDKRENEKASPIPAIVVTDLNLTVVRHTVPSTALVPVNTFNEDQIHEDVAWALQGEATRRYHVVTPEMKGWVREYQEGSVTKKQHILAVGIVYNDRVVPVAETEGEGGARTVFVNITQDGYTVLHTQTESGGVIWPNVFFSDKAGPLAVRSMAIGASSLYYTATFFDDSYSIYEAK